MGSQGAQKGRKFILKRQSVTSGNQYDTVMGLQALSLDINGAKTDITSKDDGGFQTLLAGAGVTSFAISGNGVFKNDPSLQIMQTSAIQKTLDNYQVIFENGDMFSGIFQVVKLQYTGQHDKEETYTLSLDSSGVIAYTPA